MVVTPCNVLIRVANHRVGPPLKRQKMSSTTSTSTLTSESPSPMTIRQASCSVASEDLSSMVFHVADIQRVTNSWASHHPLTGAESAMKESFKACEDTANSLRDELENLQAQASNLSPAQDTCVLQNSLKDDNNDDSNIPSAYELGAAESLKFLIKAGVEKIMSIEASNVDRMEGLFFYSTCLQLHSQPDVFIDAIQKVIEEDPQPFADFEKKVKRYVQRDMIDRAVSEFKRDLENRWKKHGDFVADT